MKKLLAVTLIASSIFCMPVYAGNISSLEFSEAELSEAKHYYDVNTVEWSPERIAYMIRAKNYVKNRCSIPENFYNFTDDEYKSFLKQYIDTLLEYLQWSNDISNFDENISDIQNHARVMEIMEQHIPNRTIFNEVLSFCCGLNDSVSLNVEQRSGQLNGQDGYTYYYTSLNSYVEGNPYFGNTFYTDSRKADGFMDLTRYIQTRDDKYLYSKEFFTDIIDIWQIEEKRDTDDHYLSLEELKKRSAEEGASIDKHMEAYKQGKYVPLNILMFYNEAYGFDQYVSDIQWYEDDSLNDSLKEMIIEYFGEEGYAKLVEQASTAERGKELQIDLSPYWKS